MTQRTAFSSGVKGFSVMSLYITKPFTPTPKKMKIIENNC